MADAAPRLEPQPSAGPAYDDVVLPHLGAARRLACGLVANPHDAEDAVQDAALRALRYFGTFTGGNARAWFLCIVRRTCARRRGVAVTRPTDPFDDERHTPPRAASDPETLLLQRDTADAIARAIDDVPGPFRELLVLRELRGLSYREIADAMGIPIGTVMSGLSRARRALRGAAARAQRAPGQDRQRRRRPMKAAAPMASAARVEGSGTVLLGRPLRTAITLRSARSGSSGKS
jgi:RNA polymerase sigma-70 factor (ECF subfamily)